ncbi:E3 ubiquitin-protein ligase SINA-like 7 [Apium graveolens]|uniref:E3 ubiquitin-protein ligase SINA-like 7 n=1 Tax=Apium graveolens TaxID=4045 RepID=UPI003D78D857
MPRYSIGENSSSSSSEEEANRLPKRRRMPFPSRVLYRHGSSSTHPAVIAAGAAALRRLPGTSSPAAAGTSTPSVAAAGASASQLDSDEFDSDSESEDDDDELEVVAPKPPPVVSGAVAAGRAACPIDLNKAVSKDVVKSGSGGSTSERVAAILSDTDVLDCAICFEPFAIPVYQCDNGHTACSSCCGKLRNKCPSCCSPIGYNRCRALEKVLEAAKITCSNSKYGCKERVSYSMKREHERSCVCEPCYCPLPVCDFDGSCKDIYLHFARKHTASVTRFTFDCSFPVRIGVGMKFKFLQEQDNTLFVLNYGIQTIGNVANIICIGPSSVQKVYSYELEASNADSTVKLTSLAHSQPKWTAGLPQKSVLLIPKVFIGLSGEHSIQVCIRRKVEK